MRVKVERVYPANLYLSDLVWLGQQAREGANGCCSVAAVVHRLVEQAKEGKGAKE